MGLDISVYRIKNVPRNHKDINIDDCLIIDEYPELEVFTEKSFKRLEHFFDIERSLRKIGHKPEEVKWCLTIGMKMEFEHIKTGERIVVKKCATKLKSILCLYIEEIGYQRKGANSQFYEDGIWDHPCILDLKKLNEHWVEYFSGEEEDRINFKKNIIDNFVEGETVVMYH